MAEKLTSLRNEIDVSIFYVNDDGKKGIKKVHITFVSQGIYKLYQELNKDLVEAIQLGNDIKKYTEDMGFEIAKRGMEDDGVKVKLADVKARILAIREKYDQATARLNEITDHLDEKKYALIKKILLKNGIEDKEMADPGWWEECVNADEAMRFIREVCTKDDTNMDDKKKLKNSIPTE